MKLSPLQRRAQRRARNQSSLDMNLVSLIDVFTILIFFLLSSAGGVELLPSPKEVRLPESVSDKTPRETRVVVVGADEILLDGRRLASVAEVAGADVEVIAPLQAELQRLAGLPPAQGAATPVARAVTLMADKDIPYHLLRKIMLSCSRAGYADVSFAVRQRAGT